MTPHQTSKTSEEEFRQAVGRLCERFPAFSAERVMEILIEADGHAGQAAARLRDLSASGMRPIDPEEAEHVKTILSSPTIFAAACQEQFQKYDLNQDSVLEWDEVLAMTNRLHQSFGLEPPRQGSLREFFDESDANHDGVLELSEFIVFYERYMRLAYGQMRAPNNGNSLSRSPLGSRSPGNALSWERGDVIKNSQGRPRHSKLLSGDRGFENVNLLLQKGQLPARGVDVVRSSPKGVDAGASSPAGSKRRAHSRS
jgi:hypothetical protein